MYAARSKDFCFIGRDALGVKRSFGISGFEVFLSRGLRAIRGAKLFSERASKLFIDSYENVTRRIWFPSPTRYFLPQKITRAKVTSFAAAV
jgi:hypothetical protein